MPFHLPGDGLFFPPHAGHGIYHPEFNTYSNPNSTELSVPVLHLLHFAPTPLSKSPCFCFLNPYNCAFFQLDLSFKDANWCYFLNFIFLIHHCSNLLFLFSSVPGSLRIVFLFLKSFDYLFLLRAISFELRLASCYIVKSCFECLIVPLLSSAWKTVLQLLPDWALTGQWEGRDQWVSFPPTSLTF